MWVHPALIPGNDKCIIFYIEYDKEHINVTQYYVKINEFGNNFPCSVYDIEWKLREDSTVFGNIVWLYIYVLENISFISVYNIVNANKGFKSCMEW